MTFFAIFTIASFPRIINMYEDRRDVRPIISKITGYFLLVALSSVLLFIPMLWIVPYYQVALAKFYEEVKLSIA